MSDSPSPLQLHTPSWEWQRSVIPPATSPSFYSSTKILMALKSMLPLLGPNGKSWPWPMQRIPSGRACWPVGIYRFDYEEGQHFFSSLSHKGALVQHQDNGTSKWHVKLTLLCALIQAFDLTNVFVPSSTSANTSNITTYKVFLSSFALYCSSKNWLKQDLAHSMKNSSGKTERTPKDFAGEEKERAWCVAEKILGMQISLAVRLLLFELK